VAQGLLLEIEAAVQAGSDMGRGQQGGARRRRRRRGRDGLLAHEHGGGVVARTPRVRRARQTPPQAAPRVERLARPDPHPGRDADGQGHEVFEHEH